MSTHPSSPDRFAAAPSRSEPTVQRLGERTCIIGLEGELRHVDVPPFEAAVEAVVRDGCEDLVFDLTPVRRYETLALVRVARAWDRLVACDCTVHVAVRDPRVVADLERLVATDRWALHGSVPHALRALLTAPLD